MLATVQEIVSSLPLATVQEIVSSLPSFVPIFNKIKSSELVWLVYLGTKEKLAMHIHKKLEVIQKKGR
jgi:hypothetical protein